MLGIAAGLLGSAFGGLFNAHQARQNRRFQSGMSSTAHQREVVDLRKAGLNPILSASKGPGASTPSGATATIESPTHSAVSANKNKAEMLLLARQSQLVQSQTHKTDTEQDLLQQQIPEAMANSAMWSSEYAKTMKQVQYGTGLVGGLVPGIGLMMNKSRKVARPKKSKKSKGPLDTYLKKYKNNFK